MGLKGKVYVVPVPERRVWQVVVHNTGDQPFAITQNVLPPQDPNRTVHDDTGRYGHGLGVQPGGVSWQEFAEGAPYAHGGFGEHSITQESFLRVGIRAHAAHTLRFPDMERGPIEIDLADFNWYSGSPDTATDSQGSNWAGSAPHHANVGNGDAILSQIQALMTQHSNQGVVCEGKAQLTAVPGQGGGISHWEVRFDNTGAQAWIGTVTFVRGQKNEGLGLESMALPGKDTAAVQRIEYLGNYGVEAAVGEKLRLGVRGYSWIEAALPAQGTVEIPLRRFRLDTSKMAPEYFDRDEILKKRAEKKDRVQFFEGGQAINAALEPEVLKGEEARTRSTFDPPELTVEPLPVSQQLPKGGWRVRLKSTLPEFDERGRLGFAAAIKLANAAVGAAAAKSLAVKKLLYPGAVAEWIVPKGEDLGGAKAEGGAELLVATRGLGWQASVRLPDGKKTVDSRKDPALWGLREDQMNRSSMRPERLQRSRS